MSERELAEVGEAALQALRAGPLTADALRRALPAGVVRSLGDRGKKAGLSSPLPAALRLLEFAGRIERTLEKSRLDGERAVWQLPRPASKPASSKANPQPARAARASSSHHPTLARLFFAAAGLARAKDFAEWSGLSASECRAALAGAALAPVAITGLDDEALAPEALLPALRAAAPATGVVWLGFEDNLLNQHGGPAPLVEQVHHGRVVPGLPSIERPVTIAEAKHMVARPLLLDGVMVGLWEYDPDSRALVFGSFAPLAPGKRRAVVESAGEVAGFLREEIGHARSAVVDNLASLRVRVARVRALA